MSYKLNRYNRVIRLLDGAWLPCTYDAGVIVALDEHSLFVREFKAWVALGNVPQPADPEPAPVDFSDVENLDKPFRAMGRLIAQYTGKTPLQVRQDFMTIYRALPA